MREAGQRLAVVMQHAREVVRPGLTTAALDAQIEATMKQMGLKPACKGFKGYRHASCISVNDIVVHGVPSEHRVLQPGDCVSIDMVGIFDGYHADMARTYVVSGAAPDPAIARLIAVAEQALVAGQQALADGVRLGVVSHAIQAVVESAGFGIIRDFVGHGIGKNMHEDPQVPNFGSPTEGPRLYAGTTLAIEPMITVGSPDVVILPDRWSVQTRDKSWAAHVENTVAVTDSGVEVLTHLQ